MLLVDISLSHNHHYMLCVWGHGSSFYISSDTLKFYILQQQESLQVKYSLNFSCPILSTILIPPKLWKYPWSTGSPFYFSPKSCFHLLTNFYTFLTQNDISYLLTLKSYPCKDEICLDNPYILSSEKSFRQCVDHPPLKMKKLRSGHTEGPGLCILVKQWREL